MLSDSNDVLLVQSAVKCVWRVKAGDSILNSHNTLTAYCMHVTCPNADEQIWIESREDGRLLLQPRKEKSLKKRNSQSCYIYNTDKCHSIFSSYAWKVTNLMSKTVLIAFVFFCDDELFCGCKSSARSKIKLLEKIGLSRPAFVLHYLKDKRVSLIIKVSFEGNLML